MFSSELFSNLVYLIYKIDFDRTKHLSDTSIRKRKLERERLMTKERELEEQERRVKEEAEKEAENLR